MLPPILSAAMLRARYRRILVFFARILIGVIAWDLILPRLGLRRLSRRTRPQRLRRAAAAFRKIAIDMGGVLIKAGQFLSARLDVLPEAITAELAGLQDEVKPEPFEQIRLVVEGELGGPLAEWFSEFDEQPLAAASLGQVHPATLRSQNGDEDPGLLSVVVKVQRPQIGTIIATDLAALRRVGGWLKRYPPIRRRVDIDALLDEFTRILFEEIDYLAEGRNAETFAANYASRPGVRVPRVIWAYTTRRVLTLENVYAIKITDYAQISAAGISRSEVAERLFHTYLQQIFVDGFFHADPHPGNLFVTPLAPSEEGAARPWLLTFVDFGMAGRVAPNMLAGLRELAIAVGTRDTARMIRAYQMLGVLLPGADLDLLEKAETAAFDLFWGKTMGELREISPQEVRAMAHDFRDLLFSMPFQIPQDLILLGRTVGILSGLCTGLDPEFNVWDGLAPFAEKLLAEEMARGWSYWLEEAGMLARALISLPRRADAVLALAESGQFAVRVPELSGDIQRLEAAVLRLVKGIVFAALLVAVVELYIAGRSPHWEILLGGAVLALVWLLLPGPRR